MSGKVNIFWFRRDLRLTDNTGLFHALRSDHPVLPVFIFDKEILDQLEDKADKRVNFIYKAVEALHHQFVKAGSSMLILHGEPAEIFEKLSSTYDIEAVFANHDYEPYAIRRDETVAALLKNKGISFFTFKDQAIFEKSEVVKYDGAPYTVFTPYSKLWKQRLSQQGLHFAESEKHLGKLLQINPLPLPTLAEIGFAESVIPAFAPIPDKSIISNYHLTRNLPSVQGTSGMSPHLRFGTVSIRKLVEMALLLNEAWLNELIWREFFMMILYHYPRVISESFRPKYDFIPWRNDESEFKKWCCGETGFPIVDAGMRQLNETGWMHNRVRMIVASFLTKHLLIDWRWGEHYFASKLLDYEVSSNNGNWQWAAGTGCDAAPYFRVFNPYEQAAKFDPDALYIRHWVREYGTTAYPKPIVDHAFARQRALDTYKVAIQGK